MTVRRLSDYVMALVYFSGLWIIGDKKKRELLSSNSLSASSLCIWRDSHGLMGESGSVCSLPAVFTKRVPCRLGPIPDPLLQALFMFAVTPKWKSPVSHSPTLF